MTIKYIDDFDFPSDFGFTGSSTPVKMNRGGMKNIRDEEARVIGVQDNSKDEMRRVESRRSNDAAERKDKRAQMARVGSRERNARDEMTRLRGEAEDKIRKGFYAASGGGKKDWIKGAVKKPGALREYMNTPEGQSIPKSKLNKVASGKPATAGGPKPSAKTMKRANLAKSFSKMT
jgi:hypothetical protein|tara:strand:+ start:123 stop:650 length:528 start_codon:yes stop_codon:yes gene_type:complete